MEEAIAPIKPSRPWWFGPAITLGVLILIASGLFAAQVWYYWRLLASGEAVNLQFTSRFTALASAGTSGDAGTQLPDVVSADDPSLGRAEAPLTIVEFADFECPFSKEESSVVRELAARYPDRVRFIYRDFPLSDIHPRADAAAQAGACAHEQGKFWAMHDRVFQNQAALDDADLERYAQEIGLNMTRFNACRATSKYAGEVQDDYASGVAAGVRGTPTFFINGRKIEGAIPAPIFEQIIKQLTKGYAK